MKKLTDYELLYGETELELENKVKELLIDDNRGYKLYGFPFIGRDKNGKSYFYQAVVKYEKVDHESRWEEEFDDYPETGFRY